MMRCRRLLLISFFVLFVFHPPQITHSETADVKITKGEGPIDIQADHLVYEREKQIYEAHGNVEISRDDFFLRADHAQLNTVTKEVMAWGNVVLREGEDVAECERLEVNLETRLGKIYNARLFLKDQNFHIIGKEAEKLGENRYRVREGSFTTCDAERPPWKFTSEELEVTMEGYGIVKGPVFRIADIPVLYLPVAVFPVRKERQTGFLLPRIDYSTRFGPEVGTAFFWAIEKDMDATFYLDRLGDSRGRGFKEGLEYRYAFAPETKGQANFHFIDDQVFGGNRYAFFIEHEQKFPYDLYLKGDINYVSDNDYVRDFDEDLPTGAKIDSRSLRQLRSVLFGGKDWDQFSFLAQGDFFKNLSTESNDETLQKLPEISFSAHPQSLFGTPFFFDLSSSYTHFWREKGVEAQRGDVFPSLSYPIRLFDIWKVEPNIGLRETVYRFNDDPTGRFEGWETRETLQAAVETSTEFYRVYDGSVLPWMSNLFKMAKWMHTIEPMVSYTYSPRVNQEGIPIFDEVDRVPFTSQATYGVTQRLVGKPQKEGTSSGPYEYARLRIFQSYSLGDPFETDSEGRSRYFSDIFAELWLHFNPYVSALADAGFNVYRERVDTLDGLLRFKDKRDDSLYIQYRFTKDQIDQFNLFARVKTIHPLYLYGGIRYNLLEHTRVDSVYGAEYQAQCWSMGLVVEDRNRSPDGTQKKELKFEVYFNLLGLGALGHKPFFMAM
jgi:LPS-assembly protein